MALTLFEDTFVTVAQADSLHSGDTDWAGSTTDEKEQALREATTTLNNLLWVGYAVSTDQSLSWPRKKFKYYDPSYNLDIEVAQDTVPTRLRKATANLALHYRRYPTAVDNYDPSFEKIKIGPLEVEDTKTNNNIPAIPFNDVMAVLAPLLRNGLSNNWWRAN